MWQRSKDSVIDLAGRYFTWTMSSLWLVTLSQIGLRVSFEIRYPSSTCLYWQILFKAGKSNKIKTVSGSMKARNTRYIYLTKRITNRNSTRKPIVKVSAVSSRFCKRTNIWASLKKHDLRAKIQSFIVAILKAWWDLSWPKISRRK